MMKWVQVKLTFCFFVLQKINAKNAFGLHLIDYMQDLIKTVKEGDMTNFQVRRTVTQHSPFHLVSGKIYQLLPHLLPREMASNC